MLINMRNAIMIGDVALPAPYKRVGRIYSDGNACLVIPHTHTNSTKISVRIIFSRRGASGGGKNLFQGAVSDRNWMGGFYAVSGNVPGFYIGDQALIYGVGVFADRDYDFAYTRDGNTVTIRDGEREGSMYVGGRVSAAHMGIFTQTNGSSHISGRAPVNYGISYFEYHDGTTYEAKLYPAVNEDTGVVGMYDIINAQFLQNVSNGSFSYDP